jgi:hypothetical protein
VNFTDFVAELKRALELDIDVDNRLVLDVAREAAHLVERPAAPISTFLLGYAAAQAGGSREDVQRLAERVVEVARRAAAQDTEPVAAEADEVVSGPRRPIQTPDPQAD